VYRKASVTRRAIGYASRENRPTPPVTQPFEITGYFALSDSAKYPMISNN
jgi:hypothetical protein